MWPALRVTANAAVNAWDNFLVFQTNSPPVMTLKLTNSAVGLGSSTTFNVLADGPGTISYSWYSNNIAVAGVTGPALTISPVAAGFTNLQVVARNGNGSVTNMATISAVTEITLQQWRRLDGQPIRADLRKYHGKCFSRHRRQWQRSSHGMV